MKNSIAYSHKEKQEEFNSLVDKVVKRLSQEYIIPDSSYARGNYM